MDVVTDTERAAITQYLANRFGIDPAVFAPYQLWRTGRKVWIAHGDVAAMAEQCSAIEVIGMALVRKRSGQDMKLTTNAARVFGYAATRNYITVSSQTAKEILAGNTITVTEDVADDGYVIVQTESGILGVCEKNRTHVRNMIPRSRQILSS